MKVPRFIARLVLIALASGFAHRSPAAPPAAAGKTNQVYSTEVTLPAVVVDRQSLFNADTNRGRDPFYPASKASREAGTTNATTSIVTPAVPQLPPPDLLVLRGISGPATGRFALINDRIVKQGEEASVRTASGPVRIKCLEITEASVVLKINDEEKTKELHLRSSP